MIVISPFGGKNDPVNIVFGKKEDANISPPHRK